ARPDDLALRGDDRDGALGLDADRPADLGALGLYGYRHAGGSPNDCRGADLLGVCARGRVVVGPPFRWLATGAGLAKRLRIAQQTPARLARQRLRPERANVVHDADRSSRRAPSTPLPLASPQTRSCPTPW